MKASPMITLTQRFLRLTFSVGLFFLLLSPVLFVLHGCIPGPWLLVYILQVASSNHLGLELPPTLACLYL